MADERKKSNYVGAPKIFALEQACQQADSIGDVEGRGAAQMLSESDRLDWMSKAREMVNDSADVAMHYLNAQLAVQGYVMKARIIVAIEFEPVAPSEADRLFAKSVGVEL